MGFMKTLAYGISVISLTGLSFFQLNCSSEKTNPVSGKENGEIGQIVSWIQNNAKNISTVDPDASDAELAMFDEILDGGRIFGFGEATHGSSEFGQMKDRMFRYLVLHKGVTAFGVEDQMGKCRFINKYLLTGIGNPAKILANNLFFVWSTEDMLKSIEWMRSYNVSHQEKIQFFGYDMQDGGAEMDEIIAYVKPIDSLASVQLEEYYKLFRPYTFSGEKECSEYIQDTIRILCHVNIRKAYELLVDKKEKLIAATDTLSYEWALQMSKVVMQTEAFATGISDGSSHKIRDKAMAENCVWFSKLHHDKVKMFLTAHNGHVNRSTADNDFYIMMGEWLHRTYGNEYKSVGFGFYEGSTVARLIRKDGTVDFQLKEYQMPAACPKSYERMFSDAGLNIALLDFQNPDMKQSGPKWFSSPHAFREIGWAWSFEDGFCVDEMVLPQRFDALIFIKNVTATKLLSKG